MMHKTLILLVLIFISVPFLKAESKEAYFAGGCFWCTESSFEKVPGVKEAISGYSGGEKKNPTYREVAGGKTKYIEAVKIIYDPKKITYRQLVDVFWKMFDPTDAGGSFHDRGYQYTSAIFVQSDEERKIAQASKEWLSALKLFDKKIVTPIVSYKNFYPAEEYHQDYYKKNPAHYQRYRNASGRDRFIQKYWSRFKKQNPAKAKVYSKPSQELIKKKLTDLQYYVTQKDGTEPPFRNIYWDHKKEGIYIDIVSKEPLFSSRHKFKSGTGWPSFYQPLVPGNVIEKKDTSHGMNRVEVRSKYGDSHLGHVFSDGPKPTGLRYCINSASLLFIPKEDCAAQGYGQFLSHFEE